MRAQRFQVGDLVGEIAGLSGLQRRGSAVSALVVENDVAIFAKRVPRCGDVQISMIEARTTVDDHERSARAAAGHFVIDFSAGRVEGLAVFFMLWACGHAKSCGKKQTRETGNSLQIGHYFFTPWS